MKAELVSITPEIAQEWLLKNTNNRKLCVKRTSTIASAIKRGEWTVNGDTIKFDSEGNMLDGQHRLSAIVKSEVVCQSMVVYDLPTESFKKIDTDRKPRTVAQVLQLQGIKNAKMVATAARLLIIYYKTGNPFSSYTATSSEIDNFVEHNPDLIESAHFVAGRKLLSSIVSPGLACFIHYIIEKDDTEVSELFFNELSDLNAVATYDGSPVKLLRNQLVMDQMSKSSMSRDYQCALVLKAYRLFKAGKKITMLRVRTVGPTQEKDIYSI